MLETGLTGRWCDRYPNQGKQSGAFSSGSFDGDPYILMNYQPDVLDHVFTLAHEAGHSMHSYYSAKHQPFQYYNYTIFVAEVASTFNEQLLARHMMEQAKSDKQRAFLINREIDAIRGTIIRQTMFAEFERITHALVEAGEPLTVERFKSEYRKLLELYFGPDFAIDDELSLECFRIPHFYRAFYVYKYATGLSAAIALAERVTSGGKKELDDYLGFLKGGLLEIPARSAARAGVDMEQPQAVDTALDYFERLVERAGRAVVVKCVRRCQFASVLSDGLAGVLRHATRTRDVSMGRRLGSAHADRELPEDRLSPASSCAPRTSTASSRRWTPRPARKSPSGLPTASVELVGLGTTCEYHSPDPAVLRKNIEETKAFIRLCHDVGGIGRQGSAQRSAGRRARRTRRSSRSASRSTKWPTFGEGYGVEIRLEIHGRGTSEIPDIRKIMDVSKHPGSKLCWNCNRRRTLDGAGLAANFTSRAGSARHGAHSRPDQRLSLAQIVRAAQEAQVQRLDAAGRRRSKPAIRSA